MFLILTYLTSCILFRIRANLMLFYFGIVNKLSTILTTEYFGVPVLSTLSLINYLGFIMVYNKCCNCPVTLLE